MYIPVLISCNSTFLLIIDIHVNGKQNFFIYGTHIVYDRRISRQRLVVTLILDLELCLVREIFGENPRDVQIISIAVANEELDVTIV